MGKYGAMFDEALLHASALHREQIRKGTDTPYLSHLLGVAALVWEAGGDEEQACAGLLHDSLEDQGDKTSHEDLLARYGSRVADTVRACSDTEILLKPPWRERKLAYLAHLESADADALLVSTADKLHNARSILSDLHSQGEQVWERFSAPREDQLWYYQALVEVLHRRTPGCPLVYELRLVVAAIGANPNPNNLNPPKDQFLGRS